MSIKDHLIKLTMWWQGAQKLRNDRPGGAAAPTAPPSVSPLPTALAAVANREGNTLLSRMLRPLVTCSSLWWWRVCSLNQTARLCINVTFLQDFIFWPRCPVTETARPNRPERNGSDRNGQTESTRPNRPDRIGQNETARPKSPYSGSWQRCLAWSFDRLHQIHSSSRC